MSTVPALWTKHRGLARTIANGYHLPGSDRDDVQQEALIALWIAARNWNPDKGLNFPNFAGLVIRRRLNTILRNALATPAAFLTDADRDDTLELQGGPDLERIVVARDTLRRLTAAIRELPTGQREAIIRSINADPLLDKQEDNRRWRARRKLKAAA